MGPYGKNKRHSQPEILLLGDVVQVMEEEEKYGALKGRTFIIGSISTEPAEEDRIYGLNFFNGKPVCVYLDGENPFYIFSKRKYLELEKRIVNGVDQYYQRSITTENIKKDEPWDIGEWLEALLDGLIDFDLD